MGLIIYLLIRPINPHDLVEEIFSRSEQQVTDINHNVNLLMAALRNKFGIFEEDGNSNAEEKSEGGLG